jgi:outer membrane receptor for ferrienterochelin and colicin
LLAKVIRDITLHVILSLPFLALTTNSSYSEPALEDLFKLSFKDLSNQHLEIPTETKGGLSKMPGATIIISHSDIKKSSAKTIPELLKLIPGVNVRWNQMVQSINIRGFGSSPFTSQVLLLIDGIPYNSWNKGGFPQHPGLDFFNINNVLRVEVSRSPSATLYGDNALNGVVNIVTLSGEDLNASKIGLSYGSNSKKSIELSAGKKFKGSKSIYISLKSSEGIIPTEFWENLDSPVKGYDLFIKAKMNNYQISYYRRNDSLSGFEVPLNSSAIDDGYVWKSSKKIEQSIDILSSQYNLTSSNDAWSVKSNISLSRRVGSACTSCHEPSRWKENPREDSGYQIFTNTQLTVAPSKHNEIKIGAEFKKNSSGDLSESIIKVIERDKNSFHNPNDHVSSFHKSGLYLQSNLSFLNEKLIIASGIRYDQRTKPKLYDSSLSPRLSLVGEVSKKTRLRFNWSKGARYPSFTELYQNTSLLQINRNGEVRDLATFISNPSLRPEVVESVELGFSYKVSRDSEINIDLYKKTSINSIFVQYPNVRHENTDQKVIMQGGEVDIRSKHNTFEWFFNWSYQHTKLSQQDERIELTYAPQNKINMGASYTWRDDVYITVEGHWQDVVRAPEHWFRIQYGPDYSSTYLDDYFGINFKASWSPKLFNDGKDSSLVFEIIGKDITNEKPIETLTGFKSRGLGRTLSIGFQYNVSF